MKGFAQHRICKKAADELPFNCKNNNQQQNVNEAVE